MSPPPTADEVAGRLAAIRRRIAERGVDPATVAVLGVTKGHPAEVITIACDAGLLDLGENYAQELVAKAASAPPEVRFHFIGQLQRNKVRQLAPLVSMWQSLDRASVVDEVARRAPGASVLVQVGVTGEPGKGGCPPEEAPALVERARAAGLSVAGLMTVGPTDPDADPAPAFRTVRRLVDDLGLSVCSMGMTGDLDVAVSEGSTMVRIGTALFGARPPRGAVGD